MKLQHIKIENLKTTAINVRKKGGKDIADLLQVFVRLDCCNHY